MLKRLSLALALVASAFLATQTQADDAQTKAQAQAQAAMAMARAKASPQIRSMSGHIAYLEAVKLAKADGKPIFVSVGLNCKSTCQELRPNVLTVHQEEFDGNKIPRGVLLIPTRDGSLWKVKEWQTLPEAGAVKAAILDFKVAHPDLSVDQSLLETLALGMIALETDGTFCPTCPNGVCNGTGPCNFCPNGNCASGNCAANCPNGNCGQTMYYSSPPPGYAYMPAAGGPVTYYADAQQVETGVTARFPRLAGIRQRLRARRNLPPPNVAGRFFTYSYSTPQVQDAIQAAINAAPVQPVGASRGLFANHPLLVNFVANHVIVPALNQKLASGALSATDSASIREILADHWKLHALAAVTMSRAEKSPAASMLTDSSAGLGRLAPGTITNFLNWILTNFPQILADITQILKLFGVLH